MKKIGFMLLLLCTTLHTVAQEGFSIYGEIKDKVDRSAISGAIVTIPSSKQSQLSDENGHFHFDNLKNDTCTIIVSTMGYEDHKQNVSKQGAKHLIIYLKQDAIALDEIIVTDVRKRESTLNTQVANKNFFFQNNAGSFAKTLSKFAGISSMDIGSGFSKPIIRGLGFNRIAVIDKGITQQDQQWGADHGLSIDQYDMEEVVVHKGPMSLQFGSDAIGGAIEIMSPQAPFGDIIYGDVTLIGKSNNDLIGTSVMSSIKRGKWFAKARYTYQDYGDYRVPADNVYYMNTNLPIYGKRLKNTAGKEHNISAFASYSTNKVYSSLSVSNVYQKNGFFAGAHGIPNADNLVLDKWRRNIELPSSAVNHLKITSSNTVKLSDNMRLAADIGYQSNHRKEESYFHSHYGAQTPPEKDPNLELDFRLHTESINAKLLINEREYWSQTIGIQSALQQNRVGGYNFLLPRYNQYSIGGYWLTKYKASEKWTLTGGVRYDYANIDIRGHYDELLATYLKDHGYDTETITENANRALATETHFDSFSASAGAIFEPTNKQSIKANIGKSFRFPTANELASNGVHHGAFRHEVGDPNLKAEEGYQFDLDYMIEAGKVTLTLSPYATYFTNYIFLEPRGDWSILPDAGQKYKYREAEALFVGGEYELHVALFHQIDVSSSGQYVYSNNETDKYPLPFTPPFSMRNQITYFNKYKAITSYRIGIEHQLFARQSRVSRNEDATAGTNLFNILVDANIVVDKFRFSVGLQAQNIFDTSYMNHLSFYRKLSLPEPGRNIQVLIKIPFYK